MSSFIKKGTLKFNDYCVFEKLRNHNEGGGLMTLVVVRTNLKPILVPIENSSKVAENILVIEAEMGKSNVRFINAYGPQENSSIDEKTGFLCHFVKTNSKLFE